MKKANAKQKPVSGELKKPAGKKQSNSAKATTSTRGVAKGGSSSQSGAKIT